MQQRRHLKLGEIVAEYRSGKLGEELAGEWAAALVFRPPALVLAWALQATPVSPTMVTLAGLLTLPLMVLAAALLAPGPAMALIVGLACLFMILDCADGTLARIAGKTSKLGHYADFAADICYRLVFYAAAGAVLARHPTAAGGWLAAGGLAMALVSAWLMCFARLCRVYAELRLPLPAPEAEGSRSGWLVCFVSGLDGLAPLLAAAAWATGLPQAFLVWILLYALLDLGHTQFGIIARLRASP